MRIDIDSAAIAANVRTLAARFGVPVCGVVKADGYGHGMVRAAEAMLDGGAAMLGVVDLAEALSLRRAGIDAPVLAWLHGARTDFSLAAAHDIEVAVSSLAQLEAAAGAGAPVHLKLDTGLGRNGVARGDRAAVLARAIELARAGARIRGIMSHLAGTSREADLAQLADFAAALVEAAPIGALTRHLANSQGALALPEARFDMVRLGMAAYGIDPDGPGAGDGSAAAALGLVPAMRVAARFTSGIAAIGLDDGLLPAPGAPVLVAGEAARVVAIEAGRLRIEPPRSGDGVLWGDPAEGEPSADAWALAAGTIGYETVTRMGAVRRFDADERVAEQLAVPTPDASAPRRVLELGLDGTPQRLRGEVVGVKRVEAGLAVSYGGEYVTDRPTSLALVALGYADGVARATTGRSVMLRGEALPICGRVAMDQLVLDLGDHDAAVGDPVELAHASAPELTGMLGARVAVELAGSVPDADAMEALGARLGRGLRAGDAVLLIGSLGAGKTTLTRGIGAALGARGTVQSPTFVLARTHRTAAGPDLQHVDAYRLLADADDEAELDDLDLDLDGAITVAEWGAPLEHALESWLRVEIDRGTPAGGDADDDPDALESPRAVRISGHGPGWPAARVRALASATASAPAAQAEEGTA
ncbi:tRNA (adenosine(37)-N6)-threonylcarbamoyltransferase complex ATPase subunit type 1 TsaE [Agrococcus sp. Marseille-P2731]|uniref:tRNA (adenosine(37)-N6)-threonylcarbamoyltransferase complex ATPase subunit type 1 TsaE n=1 Tax=Agrococcus sp. Marseille-P2731 TaxID=1841862 RepID=UPI0009312519|nr:tRNA (adenosine(37)-N6)-threonylcarbamoyltransferase complex ATPase subunit type 1 TsaE [Agrococcus sp. Marseille-P2731]